MVGLPRTLEVHKVADSWANFLVPSLQPCVDIYWTFGFNQVGVALDKPTTGWTPGLAYAASVLRPQVALSTNAIVRSTKDALCFAAIDRVEHGTGSWYESTIVARPDIIFLAPFPVYILTTPGQ